MKKMMALLLVLVLCLSLCACVAGVANDTTVATLNSEASAEIVEQLEGEWGFYLEDNSKYHYYVFHADKTCRWVTVAVDGQAYQEETVWTGTYVISETKVVMSLNYADGTAAHTTELSYEWTKDGELRLIGTKYEALPGNWSEFDSVPGEAIPEATTPADGE